MALFTNKRLSPPVALTTSPQTIYTVPANTVTIVTAITIANNTAATINVSLHLCVGNATPDDSNILIPAGQVEAHELANLNIGQNIHAGDTIKAYGSADGLTLHVSGIEIQ